MSNKILLAVYEDDYYIQSTNLGKGFFHNYVFREMGESRFKQAKADAEQIIRQAKLDLIDEILKCEKCFMTHDKCWIKVTDILAIKEKQND